jgi:hypothetical protein
MWVALTPCSVGMYGMTIQMIDAEMCIPSEDHPEIGSKHVLGKNKHY